MHSVYSAPKHLTGNKGMMEGECSNKKRVAYNDYGFMDLIFSWSIEDILNEELYRDKVGWYILPQCILSYSTK